MATNTNLYLSNLDQALTIDTMGTFTATSNSLAPSNIHATVYYGAPLAVWQAAFRYSSDSTDISGDSTSIKTMQARNLLCDTSANNASSPISTSNLYTASATNPPATDNSGSYINNVITDFSNTDDANAPDAGMDYIKELCRHIFGSRNSVDLLDNEAAVATSFGNAINSCASNINNLFDVQVSDTVDNAANLPSSDANASIKTASELFTQITATEPIRFTMGYNAYINGVTPVDENNCAINTGAGNSTSGTGATVDIYMTNTTIDNIIINTTGSGYVKNDSITIATGSGTGTINIDSLTSVQAAMLNGATDNIEFPLIVGDCFNIKCVISNNPDQENIRGNKLNATTAGSATRNVELFIKLQ
jgi:hypothetical protein